jgi:hypothetical protein
MAPLDFLSAFRSREGEENIFKAKWYIAAVYFPHIPEPYMTLLNYKGNWSDCSWRW